MARKKRRTLRKRAIGGKRRKLHIKDLGPRTRGKKIRSQVKRRAAMEKPPFVP